TTTLNDGETRRREACDAILAGRRGSLEEPAELGPFCETALDVLAERLRRHAARFAECRQCRTGCAVIADRREQSKFLGSHPAVINFKIAARHGNENAL